MSEMSYDFLSLQAQAGIRRASSAASSMHPDNDAGDGSPEDLVRRIRQGERHAEIELIERYRQAVTAIIVAARPDASAVDDLYQETFRIALEKIRRGLLREPARLSGFITALARNLAIDYFRRLASLRGTDAPGEALADPDANPLEELLRSERGEIVRRVLAQMRSSRDREVLFRLYIAGDSKAVICRDLELTSLHFNRVLFRARERYRELYLASVENAVP